MANRIHTERFNPSSLRITTKPTNGPVASTKWGMNNFPLNRFKRSLVARRILLGLTLKNIDNVINRIRTREYRTWVRDDGVLTWYVDIR